MDREPRVFKHWSKRYIRRNRGKVQNLEGMGNRVSQQGMGKSAQNATEIPSKIRKKKSVASRW